MNKLMLYTVGILLGLAWFIGVAYTLYTITEDVKIMNEAHIQHGILLNELKYDVYPIRQFRGLTNNRSFSCSISDITAP